MTLIEIDEYRKGRQRRTVSIENRQIPDESEAALDKEALFRKVEASLDEEPSRFPGLRDAIREVYTSTPATYRRYTLTPQGSAFGIRKDCSNVAATVLSPRTPVRNLYLTGQSLNLHGLLGVSMTSILTCREILGTLPPILTSFHA